MASKSHVKVAHISDLHFGPFFSPTDDKIKACRKSIMEFSPDVIVATGDFVLLGRRKEFSQAKEFLESLPFEKVVVPGNHDALDGVCLPKFNPWKRLRAFYRLLQFPSEARIGRLHIVGMDSTAFYALGRGHIDISEFERFDNDTKLIKCLAMHHHMIAIPSTGEFNTISNVDQVIEAVIKHDIQYVFHGHRHKSMHFRLDSLIWDKKLDNPVDIFSCGTTLSTRLRGDDNYNNYNQVVINTESKENKFSFVNMIFDASKRRFVPRDKVFRI